MDEKRTIVAGSRSITDYETVCNAIENSGINIGTVISGTADGVDSLGEKWAENNEVPIDQYSPSTYRDEASELGVPAPIYRNMKMAENSDALIAVWDGESSGTENMINEAQQENLEIHVCRTDTYSISDFS